MQGMVEREVIVKFRNKKREWGKGRATFSKDESDML